MASAAMSLFRYIRSVALLAAGIVSGCGGDFHQCVEDCDSPREYCALGPSMDGSHRPADQYCAITPEPCATEETFNCACFDGLFYELCEIDRSGTLVIVIPEG